MKDRLLLLFFCIAAFAILLAFCALTNMALFQQSLLELHAGIVNGIHDLFVGVVILLGVGTVLGIAAGIIKLNNMRKIQVIGHTKHGPAQVVVYRGQVIPLQSPTANPTDRIKETQDMVRLAVLLANSTRKLLPNEVESTVQQLEGPRESIPAVVRYEEVEEDVPADMSLLGIHPDDGSLELTDWEKLKMLWVVGSSSSGKSNTVSGKVLEAVRHGARLLVVDPHAVKEDSLARKLAPFESAFLCPVASKEDEILAVFNAFITEFKQRLEGKACTPRIVLICDEVNHMARRDALKAPLREVVEICGEESRGFGMYGWFVSQKCAHLKWLRDSAITVIAHALTRYEEAKLACNDDSAAAKRLINFKVGRTYIYGVDFDAPMELQQPLYDIPKIDHPSGYPGMGIPSSAQSSSNQTVYRREDISEGNGEGVGRDTDTVEALNSFALKKIISEVGKMKAQGLSNDAILKHFDLAPGGRNNQNLKAFNEAMTSFDSQFDDAENA